MTISWNERRDRSADHLGAGVTEQPLRPAIPGRDEAIPMGSAINRGLTFRMAQTPVQHYLPRLLKLIEKRRIDPSFVITDRAPLAEGPDLYKKFRDKQDGCIKVVMKP